MNKGTMTGIKDKFGTMIRADYHIIFDPSWWWGPMFTHLDRGRCGPCEGDSVMAYILAWDIDNPMNKAMYNIWSGKEVTVIGNIEDNPELIKRTAEWYTTE